MSNATGKKGDALEDNKAADDAAGQGGQQGCGQRVLQKDLAEQAAPETHANLLSGR